MHALLLHRRSTSAGDALRIHKGDRGHHLQETVVGVLDGREHTTERVEVDDVAIVVLAALVLLELRRQSLKKRSVRRL